MHSQYICKKYINQQYIELFASFKIVLRRSFMKLYHYYIKLMMFRTCLLFYILISFQALQWSYKTRIKFFWNLQSYEVIFFRVFFLSLKSLMGYGRLAYFSVEGMLLPFRVECFASVLRIIYLILVCHDATKHWFPLLFPMQPPTDTTAGGCCQWIPPVDFPRRRILPGFL